MPQFLIVGYLPDDFDPSSVDQATERDIDVLNEEMEAAGVGVFRGRRSLSGTGRGAPSLATRRQLKGVHQGAGDG